MKIRICSAQAHKHHQLQFFFVGQKNPALCRAPRGGLFSLGVFFGFVETAVKPSALVHTA